MQCGTTSLVAQRLKRLPAIRETWVGSLGWEDPLEKEMATHSSILAWRIPWMEEPGGLQSTGSQSELTFLKLQFPHLYIGDYSSINLGIPLWSIGLGLPGLTAEGRVGSLVQNLKIP